MKAIIRPALIGFTAAASLALLATVAPSTAPGRAVLSAVGVDVVVSPSPSPSPSAAPAFDAAAGAPAPPVTDPTPPVDAPPIAMASPTPPRVQGATCVAPKVIDAKGDCVEPVGVTAPQQPPAPGAGTPGGGAPCLPPGVLNAQGQCNVPQPSPSPSPAS